MKRISNIVKLSIALAIVGSSAIGGCKKYGFNVADGYGKDTLTQNITVDTTDSKPDFSMLNQAKIFPGIVDPSEPRLQNYQVTLNMNYLDETKTNRLRINVAPQPVFCTGTYAAPGEPVTIVLPANAKGLSCQIGMWTDNLTNISPLQRAPVIYTVKQLFPGVNYVRNLFGGNIYIRASFPIAQPVTLTISGACKSPDFVLGTTDPAAWKQQIMTTQVPWFDFYSNSIDFTLPTAKMKAYLQSSATDPIAELKEWDSVMKYDYQEWIGLSDTASNPIDRFQTLPQRIVLDIQPVVGYGHNGYPVVATDDQEWFNAAMAVTDTTQHYAEWGTLHEMGHNYQQSLYWVWSGIGETSNNLHSFKRAMRMGIKDRGALHPAMPDAVTEALAYAASSKSPKNFDNDISASESGDGPFQKITPFLQMFDKAGWGFFGYLNTRARHAQYASFTDQDKYDFLYEAISEYTKTDYYKFFQAWGIPLSNQARNQIAQQYPNKLATQIWKYNPLTYTGGTDPVDYTVHRSDWVITTIPANDFQPSGETTGLLSALTDGDNSTYWHSYYGGNFSNVQNLIQAGTTAPTARIDFPHTLIIDMTEAESVSDVYFIQRAGGSRNVKHLDIYTGNDPNSLQLQVSGAVLAKDANSTVQKVNLPSPQFVRYLKIVFTDSYDAAGNNYFAAMAEVGIN